MRERLADSLSLRVEHEISIRNPLKYLKGVPVEEYLDIAIHIVYQFTRPRDSDEPISLAEMVASIGHRVRRKLKQKTDTALAAKTGAFILYSFEDVGILHLVLGRGTNGHGQYLIELDNDHSLCKLWDTLPVDENYGMPLRTPAADWTGAVHESGRKLIKTNSQRVLQALSPDAQPMIFKALNRVQKKGFKINTAILEHAQWALETRASAFSSIWNSVDKKAYQTRLRSNQAVIRMANKLTDGAFYNMYSLDFRGRVNVATHYLHEQGNDLARGLLLRVDAKPMGEKGFQWLCIAMAGNWAGDCGHPKGYKSDKVPISYRLQWVRKNLVKFIGYAVDPRKNDGWMAADNPWQFLAMCIELKKVMAWHYTHKNYDMPTHVEGFIDGSNNGSQHLAALTRDADTARLVNLGTSEYPEDLYLHVAKAVWGELSRLVSKYTPSTYKAIENYIDAVILHKRKINSFEKGPDREAAISAFKEFKAKNKALADVSSEVFWLRVKSEKEWRKILKRNVLSLPYGSTAYGMSEQQIKDAKKHGIPLLLEMEHKWGAFMGRFVFDSCKTVIQKPMTLLRIFEDAGEAAEARGDFLRWRAPFTMLPVEQYYTEGITKPVRVQYGPPIGPKLSTGYYENTLQLNLTFIETQVMSKGKQKQGASPNIIHSLDAAHLIMTLDACKFPVTTIHDSFGALLPDLPDLFKAVRQTFVKLYTDNPLYGIMADIQGDMSRVDMGEFDVKSVLDSEYAFL